MSCSSRVREIHGGDARLCTSPYKENKAEVTEKEEMIKMKTAKIGAIFLISVIALAGLGIGFAQVSDTLTLHGTVNTGTYKMSWSSPDCIMGYHDDMNGDNIWQPLCGETIYWEGSTIWTDYSEKFFWLKQNVKLDACFTDEITGLQGAKELHFYFDYPFPNCVIKINFDFHAVGTIPLDFVDWGLKEAWIKESGGSWVQLNQAQFDQYFQVLIVDCDADPNHGICTELELPIQHDYCVPHYYSMYIFIRQPLKDNGIVDHIFKENCQFDMTFDFNFEMADI